jgi:hypothetical protein
MTTNEIRTASAKVKARMIATEHFYGKGTKNFGCVSSDCKNCGYGGKDYECQLCILASAIESALIEAFATPSVASPQHIFDADSPSQDCSCGWKTTPEHRFTAEQAHKAWRRHKDSVEPAAPVGEPGRTPLLNNEGMMFVIDVNNSDYSEREVIKALARWGYKAYRIKDNIPAAPPAQVAPTPESWELAARFNDWWNENGIDFLPSLDLTKGAAKELAKTAWEAALSEVAALAAQGAPGTREPQFTAEELRSCIFTYADGQINFGVTLGRVNNVLRKKHRALAQPGAPTK